MAKEKAPSVLADGEGAMTQDDDSMSRFEKQLNASDKIEDAVANEGEAIGDWEQSAGLDMDDAVAKLQALHAHQKENAQKALEEKFKAWGRRAAWTGILYPEMKDQIEAGTGMAWEDVAEGLHVPMLRSPFHGGDMARVLDEVTKKPKLVKKKGHWHVLYYVPGGKFSYKQMRSILGDGLGLVMLEPVLAMGALTRYFFHLDCEPFEVSGKQKYERVDALALSGFELEPYLNWRTEDNVGVRKQIIKFAKEHEVYQYADLIDLIDEANRPDWDYMMTVPDFRQGIRDYMHNRWFIYEKGSRPCDVLAAQDEKIEALQNQVSFMLDLLKEQFGIDISDEKEN